MLFWLSSIYLISLMLYPLIKAKKIGVCIFHWGFLFLFSPNLLYFSTVGINRRAKVLGNIRKVGSYVRVEDRVLEVNCKTVTVKAIQELPYFEWRIGKSREPNVESRIILQLGSKELLHCTSVNSWWSFFSLSYSYKDVQVTWQG